MIEIGLIERAALAFVDRAGIAVPEILKPPAVEGDRLARAVELTVITLPRCADVPAAPL